MKKHKKDCKCEDCEFTRKWGEVCDKCGKRKGTFFSPGSNLPSLNSSCQCDDL